MHLTLLRICTKVLNQLIHYTLELKKCILPMCYTRIELLIGKLVD